LIYLKGQGNFEVKTIRVVVGAKLLRDCDRAAKKAKLNRSELVPLALREHLQRVQILEAEQRDQRGYEKLPQSTEETAWEEEVLWP
jgi:metal-responsive CopG/Arc/MetJ family transcriptional regulator